MENATLSENISELQTEINRLRQRLAQAESLNRSLEEKLEAALDRTGLCLWQGRPQTGELKVFNLQNFKPGDLVPHFDLWQAKLHPDDRERTLRKYHEHLEGKTLCYEAEYRTLLPDGSEAWIWDYGKVVERDAEGRALRIMGAHSDITRRKVAEKELERLALYDPLTGLPNRVQFFSRLEQALVHARAQAAELAVLFLDLDYFKLVNDRFGHLVGDKALVAVAGILQRLLPGEGFAARLAGDEFVILLREAVSVRQAHLLADRILAELGQPLAVGGHIFTLGCSIGISRYPADGASVEQLVDQADQAMYRNKQERG